MTRILSAGRRAGQLGQGSRPEVMGALPRMVNAERSEGILRKRRIHEGKESRVTYRFPVCDVLYEGMEEPRQICGEGD